MSNGPLPVCNSREVVRVLERNKFAWIGGRGGHRLYCKGELRVTVPYHGGRDIPPGTLHKIIAASKKSRDEFR